MSTTTATMGLIVPEVTDQVGQTIKDLGTNFSMLDKMWPVGSVYLSTRNTNPGTYLGGTWQQVAQGRCLIGADSKHGAGSGGGSMSRTLSTANLPSHTHTYPAVRSWAQNQEHHYGLVEQTATQSVAFADNVMIADPNTSNQNSSNNQVSGTNVSKTNATGSGSAISVEPAWFGVYVWSRTA